jgi:hypothetical protein
LQKPIQKITWVLGHSTKDQKTKKELLGNHNIVIEAHCDAMVETTRPLIRTNDTVILLLNNSLAVSVSFEIDVNIAKAESL